MREDKQTRKHEENEKRRQERKNKQTEIEQESRRQRQRGKGQEAREKTMREEVFESLLLARPSAKITELGGAKKVRRSGPEGPKL